MQKQTYKYSSTSSSLKRKAEDLDDSSKNEQSTKPEQGHKAKKVKPTSGYVQGTGRPYRGTARVGTSAPPSGVVGVLGNKSTNAPVKSRESLAKQDTKNLNRNAPKAKVPHGVSVLPSVYYTTFVNIAHVEGYEQTGPRQSQVGEARSRGRGCHQPSSRYQEAYCHSVSTKCHGGC